MRYKVTEHFDNGAEVVECVDTDNMGVVAAFAAIDSLIKQDQSDRFHTRIPLTTHITIEVIR